MKFTLALIANVFYHLAKLPLSLLTNNIYPHPIPQTKLPFQSTFVPAVSKHPALRMLYPYFS